MEVLVSFVPPRSPDMHTWRAVACTDRKFWWSILAARHGRMASWGARKPRPIVALCIEGVVCKQISTQEKKAQISAKHFVPS